MVAVLRNELRRAQNYASALFSKKEIIGLTNESDRHISAGLADESDDFCVLEKATNKSCKVTSDAVERADELFCPDDDTISTMSLNSSQSLDEPYVSSRDCEVQAPEACEMTLSPEICDLRFFEKVEDSGNPLAHPVHNSLLRPYPILCVGMYWVLCHKYDTSLCRNPPHAGCWICKSE